MLAGLLTTFAAEPTRKSGIDKSNFDPEVRPQDDLYRSVNGTWLKDATIPADRPADGAFFELRDRSDKQVRAIIEDAAKTKDNADAQKISDLYALVHGRGAGEQARPRADPVRARCGRGDQGQGRVDPRIGRACNGPACRVCSASSSAPTPRSPTNTSPYLEQGGLGLPNESYYREAEIRRAPHRLCHHVGKMMALAKIANAKEAAAEVMADRNGDRQRPLGHRPHARRRQDLQQDVRDPGEGLSRRTRSGSRGSRGWAAQDIDGDCCPRAELHDRPRQGHRPFLD